MVEMILYNGAEDYQGIEDSIMGFNTIDELKQWIDNDEKIFKITIKIEEIEE